jgi:hypothetical protein
MQPSWVRLIVICVGQLACSVAPEPPEEVAPALIAQSVEVGAAEAELAPSAKGFVAASSRAGREYTDARWYFTTDDDIAAWYDLTYRLEDDFDLVCGDTFCEGEYSNYQSLGIRCSVESSSGAIGVCVWTFAASLEEVVAATGNVKVSTQTWRCRLPVVRGTPVVALLAALDKTVDAPIHAALPRSESSMFDGLVNCL